jgi:hypothetical protein
MGYITAYETAMMVAEGELDLEDAVRLHLTGNVMPPSEEFTEAGVAALEACQDGNWEASIVLPNGEEMEAIEVVDQLGLTAFLDAFAEGEA